MFKCNNPCCKNEGLFEIGYNRQAEKPILLCYECWSKNRPNIINEIVNKYWKKY